MESYVDDGSLKPFSIGLGEANLSEDFALISEKLESSKGYKGGVDGVYIVYSGHIKGIPFYVFVFFNAKTYQYENFEWHEGSGKYSKFLSFMQTMTKEYMRTYKRAEGGYIFLVPSQLLNASMVNIMKSVWDSDLVPYGRKCEVFPTPQIVEISR